MVDDPRQLCRFRDRSKCDALQRLQLLVTIGQLGRRVTTLEALAGRVIEVLDEALELEVTVLALLEERALRPVAWRGVVLDASRRQELDPFLMELLLSEKHATSDRWRWTEAQGQVEAVLALGLRGRALGTLHLSRLSAAATESGIGFEGDVRDADFLEALGQSISVVLDHVRVHEEFALERAQFRTVVDNIPQAVMLFNRHEEVLLINEEAKALVGRSQWDRVGDDEHSFETLDGQQQVVPRSEWPLLRAIRTGEGCTDEEYVLNFGGFRRHILLNVIPVAGEDGRAHSFVATAQDITARSQYDQRKDEFLAVASHELRSPLTPLTGFLHLARRQCERGEQVDLDVLLRAEQQVLRLRRLIDGMLDMSRIETGQLLLHRRPVDLAKLCYHVLDPWHASHTANAFALELPEAAIVADVDPDRLEQVVTNVIDNAVKHGRRGGKIIVRLSRHGSSAVICVIDEGDGMDAQTLARVFDRFYHGSGKPALSSSMGLGLYLSRQIIEQHGGEIGIESAPGSPTVVEIRLAAH
ncbi:MAG: PAS domain-containing protein [Bradymonadaceae bacterium]|nr:PAS domain-containing protein [Lujinxingiaceae bacterium]